MKRQELITDMESLDATYSLRVSCALGYLQQGGKEIICSGEARMRREEPTEQIPGATRQEFQCMNIKKERTHAQNNVFPAGKCGLLSN